MINNDRTRPHGEETGSSVSLDGDDTTVAEITDTEVDVDRCRNCNHPIHAAVSLATGLGRDCRRRAVAA